MWEGVAETRRPCVSQVLRNAINGVALYSLCLAAAQVRSIGRGRASLAVPAAGGIHDDLVTPYLAAACVGLTQRRRVMTRKTRKIHKIDPETGVVLRTIESNRFVTGVSWIDGELGRI